MAKLNICLDLRRGLKDGTFPLKISVAAKGGTVYIPLGISVKPDQWDKAARKVVRHPRRDFLNAHIAKKLLDFQERLLKSGEKGMTAAVIKDSVLETGEGGGCLLAERIRVHTERCRTEGNKKIYMELAADLAKYDPAFRSVPVDKVDRMYIEGFDAYMAKTKSVNSRAIRMRTLRAVFNSAIDDGVTSNYPFRKFKIRHEPTKKRALTAEGLRSLMRFGCEPYQEEYRDMFLLMVYLIGINAADLFLAPKDAVKGGRFEYIRAKTHKLYSIKVEPEAAAIIERYKGERHLLRPMDRYSSYKDYLHHMNDALKAVGRRLGKRGRAESEGLFPALSSYWSRHTWASLAASLDIPIETVGRALGHSVGAAVTNIYIDFDMKKVDEANRKVIDYITEKGR